MPELNPEALNQYLYVERTPTWLIRGVSAFALLAWLLVLYGFGRAIEIDPVYRYLVAPILALFTVYYFVSHGLNLFYRRFSVAAHEQRVKDFWHQRPEPSVDIFLPICGEDLSVLQNTWTYVSRLNYSNKRVYVLDDSASEHEQHRALALSYGFAYLARPNRGWMKKAGNLHYAYQQTNGTFVAIFDADFAPHPDFLRQLLPYTDDPQVAIVQSPQYFASGKALHDRAPLAYGAGHVQEAFYRYIQVSRDRFGAPICCGSNAVYRRSALEAIGGPVLIEHSEDARTGFRLTDHGYRVRYVPVILAIGLCPDDAHAYFHQQHRWCLGSVSLLLSREFWQSRASWRQKACYWVGFLFYMSFPLSILFSFQLFWTLFFYNRYISLANGLLFYPYLACTLGFMLLLPIDRFRTGCLRATFLQTYSYSHAVCSAFLNSAVGWIPTNAKHAGVSVAFKQATTAVGLYLLVYLILVALALRTGMLHLFNYEYYSVQFWIIYNATLSGLLLWQMYRAMERAQEQRRTRGAITRVAFTAWQVKTAGFYLLLLTGMFVGIVLA